MLSINRKKLSESVIEEIRAMIEEGELQPGDKLPNQNEFAAQLGVSRTVLREALQTLVHLRVIEQRPKHGTVILAKAPFFYAKHLVPPLMADEKAAVELIQARKFIEVGAVELAAKYATNHQIREMGELVADMAKILEGNDDNAYKDYAEKNMAFHFLIAKSSHNRFMVHFMATIRGLMEQWTQESISVLPGLADRSVKSHKEVWEAIRDRDDRKAVRCMKKHISDFQESLEHYHRVAGKKKKPFGR